MRSAFSSIRETSHSRSCRRDNPPAQEQGDEMMTTKTFVCGILVAGSLAAAGVAAKTQSSAALARPGFHHLHMNSPNPTKTIDEFMKLYPASAKVTVGGLEGIRSANGITLLFTKVNTPPPAPGPDRIMAAAPQTAFWH